MTTPDRFALAPDVVLQMIDGEAVVLKLEEEVAFSLNETGARIAQLASEGLTSAAVTARLSEEMGIEPADIETDVQSLILMLVDRGILVERPSA